MEQVIARSDDPWNWTIDQLVDQICRSPSLFRGADKSHMLPDGDALETRLRQRRFTGETFLTTLDSDGLRSELGVHSLSERRSLFAVIDFLRAKSNSYKQHAAAAAVQALTLDNADALSSVKTRVVPTNYATAHAGGHKRQQPVQVDTESSLANRTQPPRAGFGIDGGQSRVDGDGEWDHLMHWEEEEDESFAITAGPNDQTLDGVLFGDESEDEGHYVDGGAAEEASDTPSDGDEDSNKVSGTSKLSQDQIVDIINERIEYFTNRWHPNRGVPKGEEIHYDQDAMRQRAIASNTWQRLVQTYEAEIHYFTHRLDEMCDEILKVPGRSADQVRKQCRNLEVTISSKLLSEWLLSVYQSGAAGHADGERSQSGSPTAGTESYMVAKPNSAAGHEVIDLGSPSEASEDELEEMLVDSSSAPELTDHHDHSSFERFHTPDSVLGDTEVAHTIQSHSDVPTQTPPTARTAPPRLPPTQLNDAPELASIASARRWTWAELINSMDRKRIVTKALSEMPPTNLETIRTRLSAVGRTGMMREIPACIVMFARHETKISGVLQRDMNKIIPFTRLFLCWWLCDNYFAVEASKADLHDVHAALQRGMADSRTFCDYVSKVMSTTFSRHALAHPEQPSQAEIIPISDDEGDTPTERMDQRIPRREEDDVIMID
ncbi:hypothetical protein BDU57DRAFT_518853 [Ampelomyces quisqualis]|uniref:DUF7607 domain-containing protein n=1 Tax=Ampelomyces quisqualis TaxID=50730 RepID=A0A6A5QLM0_AMPQU|nr:hypothetical protein BDU57DRAFT_518853 [Ampelomyces quisqualis]